MFDKAEKVSDVGLTVDDRKGRSTEEDSSAY
jgi:hypothetical protein